MIRQKAKSDDKLDDVLFSEQRRSNDNLIGRDQVLARVSEQQKRFFGTYISFFCRYTHNTPNRLKVIDAYLSYVFLTGVIQFVYCCLVGTFPFNAFLSGFISCVGSFILGVCLRLQVIVLVTLISKVRFDFANELNIGDVRHKHLTKITIKVQLF